MNETPPLLHVARSADLERAREEGIYRCVSLETEGFIHCCEADQLPGVMARYYADVDDLVLLALEREALGAEVRHEAAHEGGERFPHVYGPVELTAVRETTPFGLGDPARETLTARD